MRVATRLLPGSARILLGPSDEADPMVAKAEYTPAEHPKFRFVDNAEQCFTPAQVTLLVWTMLCNTRYAPKRLQPHATDSSLTGVPNEYELPEKELTEGSIRVLLGVAGARRSASTIVYPADAAPHVDALIRDGGIELRDDKG